MEDSNNRSHKNSHSNNCLPINKLVIVEAVVAVILLLALLLTMRFYFEELQGLRDVHKQVVQDYLKDQLLIGTVMADLD